MNVTLLDIATGKQKECSDYKPEPSVFWWTDGNGCCDCNRATIFGAEEAYENQRRALGIGENICLGSRRWLVIRASGDLEGLEECEAIRLANRDYCVA